MTHKKTIENVSYTSFNIDIHLVFMFSLIYIKQKSQKESIKISEGNSQVLMQNLLRIYNKAILNSYER